MGISRRLLAVAAAVALAAPLVVHARTVLVVAAHPDDEVIMAAGRIRTAVNAGDVARIAIVTNGDLDGVARGLEREGESVYSAQVLGLVEPDVVFLGYADDGLRALHDTPSASTVIPSPNTGLVETYGARGLGLVEWHRYRTGSHAPYTVSYTHLTLPTILLV